MPSHAPSAPRLGVGRKLLFTGVVLLGVLGVVEGVARLLEADESVEHVLPEPVPGACDERPDCVPGAVQLPSLPPDAIPMVEEHRAGWGFVPGSTVNHGGVLIRINELGLRGATPPEDKATDEVRLFSVGDSTVYGFGVAGPEVFGNAAAELLGQRLELPVAHFNGALPGYSSSQAMLVLEDVGPRIQLDWLVVACMWSDLFHVAHQAAPGERVPLASYRALVRLLGPWLPPRRIGWWDPERGVGTPGEDKSPRTKLADYMDNLHALAGKARELGGLPVFVALPAPIDLEPGLLPPYIQDYRAAMYTVARENDAPFLDAPAYFREHGATGAFFFDQVHPSAEGHRLLGQALADTLEAEIRGD